MDPVLDLQGLLKVVENTFATGQHDNENENEENVKKECDKEFTQQYFIKLTHKWQREKNQIRYNASL